MTRTPKIHIAGPLIGSVQRCVRCHTRIDSNRTWQILGRKPVGWREGALIEWNRHGAGALNDDDPRIDEVRPCGRQVTLEGQITSGATVVEVIKADSEEEARDLMKDLMRSGFVAVNVVEIEEERE